MELIITNVSLKIKIKLHQYMGTFFLICGITLIITFSEKNNDIFNINDLINIYLQPIVIIYICSIFLIIAILLIICTTPLFCNIIPYYNFNIILFMQSTHFFKCFFIKI